MKRGDIFVRHSLKVPFVSRVFRGEAGGAYSLEVCLACHGPMGPEDDVVLVPLGPGDDQEAREKAAAGGYFNAVAVAVHKACALGEVRP